MFPYMAGKEDVGSYRATFAYSRNLFASRDPGEMARKSGSIFDPERSRITLQSLGQWLEVDFPGGNIRFARSSLCPVWPWRLVVLNYLWRADDTPVSRRLISYRELENGQVFYPAFARESIQPLVKKFSQAPPDNIRQAFRELSAGLRDGADVCGVFDFLPRFPVTVKIWLEDEEIGGSANILFDATANHYLHTEDVAVAGNLVSYFLIKQYESLTASAGT